MAIDSFNKFLFKAAGTTGKAINYAMSDYRYCADAFFKPYKGPANFAIRTATIFSAPIASAILAVEALAVSIFCAFKALGEVCMGDTKSAGESILNAVGGLISFVGAVISVFVSALINLVDLIGGGVASIKEQCEEEQLQPSLDSF